MTTAELLEQARKLTRDEQMQLAHDLWVEADGPYDDPAEVDAAWATEVGERLQGIVDGTTTGIPDAEVRKIIFAVDPVGAVIDEALAFGADLLIIHHPLLLTGVHSVAADTAKGRLIHRLITGGCGLYVAHTNADHANPGVSDALAAALGLRDTRPLVPAPAEPYDKVVVFVPVEHTDAVIDAMAAAGAGALGDYTRCAWSVSGTGTFQPGAGAQPAVGEVAVELLGAFFVDALAMAPDLGGEQLGDVLGQAEGLADIADRAFAVIAHHR